MSLDVNRITETAINNTTDEYKDRNLEQMMSGKTKDGSDITPSYLNDPYFKSRESAQRYSDWKDRIAPYSTGRKKGTPNLFITGVYHSTVKAEVGNDGITMKSTFAEASDIERKYGRGIYGIGGRFKEDYMTYALRPEWKEIIQRETGLKLVR